jgi:hypothetical protein
LAIADGGLARGGATMDRSAMVAGFARALAKLAWLGGLSGGGDVGLGGAGGGAGVGAAGAGFMDGGSAEDGGDTIAAGITLSLSGGFES